MQSGAAPFGVYLRGNHSKAFCGTEEAVMRNRSHLLPFLWLHGEGEEALRRGVADIAKTGCGALCAESRVHPDFLGPSWWHEMGVLLEECKRQGMGFYLLDDTHFPSGFANGAGADTPYQRMMLREKHVDIVGPRRGGCLLVWPDDMKSIPVAVVAGKKQGYGNRVESFVDLGGFAVEDLIDLTDEVRDGLLYWNVPEGTWRIFLLTAEYVAERNPPQKFLNPLLPDSSRLMIETVYRPHADFFGAETGKTFLGFFSDEPALRAGRGSHAVLGEFPQLPVPWRMDMPQILSERMGREARCLLPGLWYEIGPMTPLIRYAFMDAVSELYGKNYSAPIGAWCQARELEYVGHVIEQNNAHSRLGQGAGHFFRAIGGQTMAGMDYVLHELKPEAYGGYHAWHSQDFEAEDDFFRFMLPQMTASAAALDPKKKGRALCECFGAYGWQEDAAEMRYLANLLLSRGINYFTPHAFSLKPAPDPDSPPHFGAFHPLEPFIGRLFRYMEKTAALIDGGRHVARAAALYYAEGEWACGSGVMKTQRIVRALNEAQIACQVVPIDDLQPGRWEALLIPYSPRWPKKLFEKLKVMQAAGCAVAFVDGWPAGYCDGEGTPKRMGDSVPLSEAAAWCASVSKAAVRPSSPAPMVHAYPYDGVAGRLVLFFNESDRENASFSGWVEGIARPVLYDPEMEACAIPQAEEAPDGCTLHFTLTPGQLLIVSEQRSDWPQPVKESPLLETDSIAPRWRVSFPGAENMEPFETETPGDITRLYPRFSGTVRYEASVSLPGAEGLGLPYTHGAVRVWVDEKELGARVAPPYHFPGKIAPGTHRLRIEITNAPVFRWRDGLSCHAWLPPTGLTGPIALLRAAMKEE